MVHMASSREVDARGQEGSPLGLQFANIRAHIIREDRGGRGGYGQIARLSSRA